MNLNKEQLEAVQHFEGPCVVTAIPGSGKTRTLTSRVVHLVQSRNIDPKNILCLTFTNKAAAEMKIRISEDLGNETSRQIWISTFHKLCIAILRKHGDKVGLSPSFSIYNEQDQKELITKVARMQDCDDFNARYLASVVNNYRESTEDFSEVIQVLTPVQADIIKEYLEMLDEFNAIDFSGLLYKTWRLLKEYPKVADALSKKFQYVLVDEGQDTNTIQYEIIKYIASHNNLFIVGDYQQSIFSWRGACPENLHSIKKDFTDVREIVLSHNYRSTPQILQVAQNLIRHNSNTTHVLLQSNKDDGSEVVVRTMYHPEHEASSISNAISMLREQHGYGWQDFAILYRTNHQSQLQEVSLRSSGIPYKILGGFSFFDRKEIKTALAYLSFVSNPHDSISFSKAVAAPRRGIGDKWIGELEKISRQKNISIIESSKYIDDIAGMPQKTRNNLKEFVQVITDHQDSNKDIFHAATDLFSATGYYDHVKEISAKDDAQHKRLSNLEELLLNISDFADSRPSATIRDYLHSVEVDMVHEDTSDAVSLLTMHSAKGLEFPVVFVIGVEKDIIPHIMSIKEGNQEEERRLFYVALTRAKDRLFISHCKNRKKFNFKAKKNYIINCKPSIFLQEISDEYANNV